MNPAWSVVLFTTLAGAGQGLFVAVFVADLLGSAQPRLVVAAGMAGLALTGAGLVASFFHLGRPARAWRAILMWRTSWLSREVIALPAFMALLCMYLYLGARGMRTEALVAGGVAAAACAALFVCTGMIYACLKFLQEWHTPLTLVNFAALGCASGLTTAALIAAAVGSPLARPYAVAAILAGAAAYAVRLAILARNRRLRPKSTTASAIGVHERKVVQISQGAMGGSFNTREFFHGRPREVVLAARAALLALVFPVPAILLLVAGDSAPILALAFATQFAGLLAERWYFFAEARHPQNLYYQAIA